MTVKIADFDIKIKAGPADGLGPLLAEIEARLNTFLLPMLGMDSATQYVKFNIEKLQGSFEEQAKVEGMLQ